MVSFAHGRKSEGRAGRTDGEPSQVPHRGNRGVKIMTCSLRKSLLFLLILGGPALAADQTPTESSVSGTGDESTTLGEVIVTGTRVQGLKAEDSLAPVQIIGSDALNKVGEFDLSQGLL